MSVARVARVLVVALVLALATTATSTSATADAPAPAVRVMVNGDSISQGFDGDVNWRARLWKELQRQRVRVDMVGPFDTPYVGAHYSSAAYASSAFDRAHCAIGGTTLRAWLTRIARFVRTYAPDVLVVELGVNDLRLRVTPEQLVQHFETYVTAARSARPDLRFLVAPVLMPLRAPAWLATAITRYNALLAEAVTRLDTDESPITLAATGRGWSPASMTWDGVHPNGLGESLIAQRIGEALAATGAVPGLRAPSIPQVGGWQRLPVVKAKLRRGRVVLTWDTQRTTGARVSVRRVGKRARTYAVTSAAPGQRFRTRKLVRGATYEFRVSLSRRAMVTPFGPAVRVRVARHH